MKREWVSIGLACGVGALIGALTALELKGSVAPDAAAMIGMIVGSLIGYITIDFQRFRAGVGHAYQETLAWRPDPLYWATWAYVTVSHLVMTATSLSYFVVAIVACMITYDSVSAHNTWLLVSFMLVVGVPSFTAISMLMGIAIAGRPDSHFTQLRTLVNQRAVCRKMVRQWNPIMAPLTLVINIYRAAAWLASGVTKLVPICAEFAWRSFIYVHSQRRTICFVDAGIGALVGFACGDALVGALVGALLGIINYEVVAVWWLKLPVRR